MSQAIFETQYRPNMFLWNISSWIHGRFQNFHQAEIEIIDFNFCLQEKMKSFMEIQIDKHEKAAQDPPTHSDTWECGGPAEGVGQGWGLRLLFHLFATICHYLLLLRYGRRLHTCGPVWEDIFNVMWRWMQLGLAARCQDPVSTSSSSESFLACFWWNLFLICVFDTLDSWNSGMSLRVASPAVLGWANMQMKLYRSYGCRRLSLCHNLRVFYLLLLKVAITEACLTQGLNYCLKTNPTWKRISRNTWTGALSRSGKALPGLTWRTRSFLKDKTSIFFSCLFHPSNKC